MADSAAENRDIDRIFLRGAAENQPAIPFGRDAHHILAAQPAGGAAGWLGVGAIASGGGFDPARTVLGDCAVATAMALAGAGGWYRISYADHLDGRSAAWRPRYSIRDLRAGDGCPI